MKKVAFFDTKPYDREWFDRLNTQYAITYYESKLNAQTAQLANGFDAVCAFVNDTLEKTDGRNCYVSERTSKCRCSSTVETFS